MLPATASMERFACRLAGEQAGRVHLHAATEAEAAALDDLLWTFSDTSFLPHRLLGEKRGDDAAVTIGWDVNLPEDAATIINLAADIGEYAERFQHLIELVPADEELRRRARERYRQYRERNFEIESRDIGPHDARS